MKRFATAILLFALCIIAYGQSTSKPVTMSVEKADVAVFLQLLFTQTKSKFKLDKGVKGKVTLVVKSMPFEDALKKALKQVDAVYSLEDGVYKIHKAPADKPKSEFPLVFVKAKNMPVKMVLQSIFGQVDYEYVVRSNPTGKVSASLKDTPLDDALRRVLEQVNATFTIKGKTVYIDVKKG